MAEVAGDAALLVTRGRRAGTRRASSTRAVDHGREQRAHCSRVARERAERVHLGRVARPAPRGLRSGAERSRRCEHSSPGAAASSDGHLEAHLEACGDDVRRRRPRVRRHRRSRRARGRSTASRPDVIYHLAALTHVGESWQQPDGVHAGQRARHDQRARRRARESFPSATVVLVSSADVYGVVQPSGPAAARDVPRRAGEPVLVEQGRGRALRARGRSHERASASSSRGPSTTSGRASRRTFVVPATREPAPRRERRGRATRSRSATCRRDGTSATCATSCGPIACWPSTGSIGEVYNVASGHDVALARRRRRAASTSWRPACDSWPIPSCCDPWRSR